MSTASTKALLAGVSGTVLQWYDFALFGYFAPIISETFFPEADPFASLLNTFGLFAVGYLLAPLGAVFFGYIGDRIGRKPALTLSILMMAIPTALISIVPGYQLIGIAAPLILTLLRIIQGFVASSEFTGSAIFLIEHANPKRKALYGSLTSLAYNLGMIAAGLAASFFTASFMPAWGWRLGFALALITGIVIFYLRTRVAETPEYQQGIEFNKKELPLVAALKEAPHLMIGIMGIAWLVSIMTFGTYVFAATYMNTYFNISLSLATFIMTLALGVDALLEPFIAILSDRIGLLPVIKWGMVALLLFSIPIFYLLSTGSVTLITVGMVLMSVLIAITYAPMNAYMITLFPPRYRCSGFGVAFNLSISLFGGTTPLVMLWLISKSGNLTSPAWYYMFAAIIGLASLALCEYGRSKTTATDLSLRGNEGVL